MNFNINEESRFIKKSTEKKYGNLLVDTTIKEDRGIIDLTNTNSNKSTYSSNINLKSLTLNSIKAVDEIAATKIKKINTQNNNKELIKNNNSITLRKGEKVFINSNKKNIFKLLIVLDWDIEYKGNYPIDLDTSVFMVDANGNTMEKNFIFYGNTKSLDNAVKLGEDYNTEIKKNYKETIQVDLKTISENVEKLAFTVTIYEGEKRQQNFSKILNGYFRVIDIESESEIFSYKFNDGLNKETAVVIAEIYRYKEFWKLNPIGDGFNGGLGALSNNYGIEIE
ncbi:TerD family protein [Clostridium botulinum D/C]|uniref:TerD family protein n=1 Tax=Clostridium botulinum TaxID=1491 RepID=UPI001E447ED8|nr:TerD family protein [Clostridium botulinum]MCD3318202.1 TerD family protein [Clostridium botulinum D/C]